MSKKTLTILSIFLLLSIQPSLQKQQVNQFCQFNSDCATGCCYSQSCQDYNTCTIMSQILEFENKNYCKLDNECDGGSTQCCFEQKCVSSDVCIQHYYLPLLLGLAFSLLLGFGISILIDRCLKNQAKKIKKELRAQKRKANRIRQKQEMKQLLGEEGYEQYKQKQKENNQKSSNSDEEEEEEDKQIKVDGQQFILPQDESQHPLNRPNHKVDDFDLNAFLDEPKKQQNHPTPQQLQQMQMQQQQQKMMMMNQQQMNPQQLAQFNQQMMLMQAQLQRQQQQQLPRQQQQQMQMQMQGPPPQQMQQQQQMRQQIPTQQQYQQQQMQKQNPLPFQDKLQPKQQQQQPTPGSQQNMNRPGNSLQASKLNNSPQFFGKQNPNQQLVQAQNPIYPDYKPSVPNPSKLEQNIIKNAPVNNELNEKRQIINQNKGALSKHLSQKPRDQV